MLRIEPTEKEPTSAGLLLLVRDVYRLPDHGTWGESLIRRYLALLSSINMNSSAVYIGSGPRNRQ